MKSGLSSKPSEIDEFAHEGHDNTAQILLDVVKTNNDGLMIALEGAWGSGKSSVIEMLKNKAKKKDKTLIKIFCFDSWAHEGDPLRLAFLLSIIDQAEDQAEDQAKDKNKLDDKTFKDLKKKITGTEKTTVTKQTISSNAKWVAGASLLVPFGLALISLIVEEYDVVVDVDWSVMFVLSCIALITYAVFSKKDRNKAIAFFLSLTLFLSILFYVKFNPSSSFTFFQSNFDIITSALWLGVVLSLAPFLVLLIQILFKEKREEKESQEEKKKSSGWSFFTSEVTETQAKEFTEGGDKTSIDFEEYFSEILKNIQKPNSNNVKVVFVVDNIDRVSEENALRIWSTLQIFMQKKRENVFFIVPYDPVGLQEIWKNINEDEKPHRASRQIVLNSFLDKSFDLRIEIPIPLYRNWRNYASNLIQNEFSDWSADRKNTALDIIDVNRKSVSDGLSPRQIKIYLNHLNVYFRSNKFKYHDDSICYFVYLRYIKEMSNLAISDHLVNGEIEQYSYFNSLSKHIFSDLCGIVCGVEASTGLQIISEKIIRNAVKDADQNTIDNLYKEHAPSFFIALGKCVDLIVNFNISVSYFFVLLPVIRSYERNQSLPDPIWIFFKKFVETLYGSDSFNQYKNLSFDAVIGVLTFIYEFDGMYSDISSEMCSIRERYIVKVIKSYSDNPEKLEEFIRKSLELYSDLFKDRILITQSEEFIENSFGNELYAISVNLYSLLDKYFKPDSNDENFQYLKERMNAKITFHKKS